MFKRVMIVVCSILAMVFLALLLTRLPRFNYQVSPSKYVVSQTDKTANRTDAMAFGPSKDAGAGPSDTEYYGYDKNDGHLTRMMRVNIKPIGPSGLADLVNPEIIFFSRKDPVTQQVKRTSISAPRGQLDSGGNALTEFDDIKHASLNGGVVIRQDAGTPDDPSDDLVVKFDHIEYDQRTGQLATDDPVTVRSPEQDVDALGMRIFLFEHTTEIRELQFLKEVHFVVRRASGGKGDMALGLEPSSASAAPAAPPIAEAPPAASTAKAPGRAGSSAASSAGPAAGPPPEGDLYSFVLKGNVHAVQGERRLDADELTMFTRSKVGLLGKSKSKKKSASAAAAPASTAASAGSAKAARPAKAATDTTAVAARDLPAPKRDTAGVVPFDIVCDGPFIMTSIPGDTQRKLYVHAVGNPVVLVDRDIHTRSAELDFDQASGNGVLTRTKADPVEVVLQGTNKNKVTGDVVRFNFNASFATAQVDGQGRLDYDTSSTSFSLTGATGAASDGGNEKEKAKKEPFVATWTKQMRVGIARKQVTDATGNRKPGNFLQWARFSGDAVLRQGEQSLSGNQVGIDFYSVTPADKQGGLRQVVATGQVAVSSPPAQDGKEALGDLACEYMVVDFGLAADGNSSLMRSLYARDKVVGAQADGGIEAGEMKVLFTPDPKAPTKPKATGIIADKNVRVRRSGIYAEAEHLETDEAGDAVHLRGTAAKWAMASQGGNKITGPDIHMVRKTGRVDVTGPGALDVLSNQGLEGEKLKEPTPLHIAWTQSMFFDGTKNQAHFAGGTQTRMPTNSVDCEDLWVFFADAEAKAKVDDLAATASAVKTVAAKPAGKKGKGALGDDSADPFRNNKKNVARLVAVDKVIARNVSVPADAKAELNVTTLKGDKLDYDAVANKAYIPGPGTLEILSVGREPAATPPHQRKASGAVNVSWKKAMIFDRGNLEAYFGENVVCQIKGRLIGGSGGASKTPADSLLKCQDLRLYFKNEEPATAERTEKSDSALPGKSLAFSKMLASGKAWFRDTGRQAQAEQMSYDQITSVMTLTGSAAALAEIWEVDAKGGLFNYQSAEQILYNRETGDAKVIGPQNMTLTPKPKK